MNVMIVAQSGRWAVQSLLFAETYVRSGSAARNPLYIAVPEPGPLWPFDPRPPERYINRYRKLGAQLISFKNSDFGFRSGYTNKIYALFGLPANQPFMFLDSDQLVFSNLGNIDLDFDHPSAQLAKQSWPPARSTFPHGEVWRAVYELTGATQGREGSGRYFNAGCFYYVDPRRFGQVMLDACLKLAETKIPAIANQPLIPAPIDQVALSVAIERIGEGGACPASLNSISLSDTTATWHYHRFSRFWLPGYERAASLVEAILKEEETGPLARENDTLAFLGSALGRQVSVKADEFLKKHQAKLKMRDAGKLMWQLGFE